MNVHLDATARIDPKTIFDADASVGFCTAIGDPSDSGEPVHIGKGVHIGSFCLIEPGSHLEDGVYVDHYCRIARNVRVGANTRILYRAQVFDEVAIGKNCIIAGELVDRTVVGDNVTFQGSTAHAHNDPTGDWDETEEPSPVIKSGSVIGVGALLLGGVMIGPRSYVAAGERVNCDVPPEMVLRSGNLHTLASLRGVIKVRDI